MSEFEDAKGRVKQAAGDLTGKETLEQEGEAQSEKSQAEAEASEALAEVKGREAEAWPRRTGTGWDPTALLGRALS